ncbi:MAG: hypothetical protein VKJ24_11595 [Synechococcales bacterium]|nr:hypothetical protein [Synechococcales bacterium]
MPLGSSLPPDDLPPQILVLGDRLLRQQLELAMTCWFWSRCNPRLQYLLSGCEWSLSTTAQGPLLMIACPDRLTNWHILNQVVPLGTAVAELSQDAKLRIYPSFDRIDPFEIRVDELPIYRDPA